MYMYIYICMCIYIYIYVYTYSPPTSCDIWLCLRIGSPLYVAVFFGKMMLFSKEFRACTILRQTHSTSALTIMLMFFIFMNGGFHFLGGSQKKWRIPI